MADSENNVSTEDRSGDAENQGDKEKSENDENKKPLLKTSEDEVKRDTQAKGENLENISGASTRKHNQRLHT